MQKIKLSLIIPIYGVEKYIGKLLESLTPNLMPGIEVIMIDDGSKDNCGEIIDGYQRENTRYVKVVHKENGGVSSARNAGLAIATGEYIAFVDGDDYIHSDYYNAITEALAKYSNPDLLFFGYFDVYQDNEKVGERLNFTEGKVGKSEFIEKQINSTAAKGEPWNKVIRSALIKKYQFDEKLKFGEDTVIFNRLMFELNSIAYTNKPLYYYRKRSGSLVDTAGWKDKYKFFNALIRVYASAEVAFSRKTIAQLAGLAYDILRVNYIIDGAPDQIANCEQFIKRNIFSILLSTSADANLKRQCIFVWLGLARSYNQRKYKS